MIKGQGSSQSDMAGIKYLFDVIDPGSIPTVGYSDQPIYLFI